MSNLGNITIKKDSTNIGGLGKIVTVSPNDQIIINSNKTITIEKEKTIVENLGEVTEVVPDNLLVSSPTPELITEKQECLNQVNQIPKDPVLTKEYILGVTDHGKLKGLLDNDHPQYLTKEEAQQSYQSIIYIGDTPPPNPYFHQIWIQI